MAAEMVMRPDLTLPVAGQGDRELQHFKPSRAIIGIRINQSVFSDANLSRRQRRAIKRLRDEQIDVRARLQPARQTVIHAGQGRLGLRTGAGRAGGHHDVADRAAGDSETDQKRQQERQEKDGAKQGA